MNLNGAQLHLLINHLPVLMPLAGIPLIVIGTVLKSSELKLAGTWILFFCALAAIAVYLTGEPAEKLVKNYPGVSRILIHDHERAAKQSFAAMEVAGAIALIYLYGIWRKAKFASRDEAWGIFLVLWLVCCGLMARTAHLGGLIRHEEIQSTDRF